jgi:L-ascorbate metabolism protein UlaG (beta-lactamase superfamily)
MPIKIDYLGHSGFFVETDKSMFLFDYYYGDLSFLEEKSGDKPLFVFSSHGHGDHFNPEIFSIVKNHLKTIYLLSFDIKGKSVVQENRDIQYLDADKTYEIEELGIVKTLLSTDEGIAFLIQTNSVTLFYAGDLHWWDWPGEDPEWLQEQEVIFKREIGKITDMNIDIVFSVLDARLEENYAKGMMHILSELHPRHILPMHFWEDRTVVERFKELSEAKNNDTIILDTTKETHWEL